MLCIFDAKKECKKKSLNKFSLAADLLKFKPLEINENILKNIFDFYLRLDIGLLDKKRFDS